MTPAADRRRVAAAGAPSRWVHASVCLVLVAAGAGSVRDSAARMLAPPARPLPVDLNAAGAAELSILPGVGPSLAAAILADRKRSGRFPGVDDLDRVRGIGPATLARLRPHVSAGSPAGDKPAVPAYAPR